MQELVKAVYTPNQTYKPSGPFTGKVISSTALTREGEADEVRHIHIDISGSGLAYIEGQSIGIVPPGLNEKGKRNKVRLYSVSSPGHGDKGRPESVSICVRRLVYQNEAGETIKGLCSNYLCDLQPGEEVEVTGPAGRTFFLPQDKTTDLVLIATGTGIAPYRSYLKHIHEVLGGWEGNILMFFGVKYESELLYITSPIKDVAQFEDEKKLTVYKALSREHFTELGRKVYVQDIIAENKEAILPIFNRGNFSIYMCGLKGMEHGIEDVFSGWMSELGKDWKETKQHWRKLGRWNIEVY